MPVGAGAVGCFYGSRLHQPEHSVFVSLVCRSNYKTIVEGQSGAVHMRTRAFGDWDFRPEFVFSSIADAGKPSPAHLVNKYTDASDVTWDYVVVATKALPDENPDEPGRIAPVIEGAGQEAAVVLIQNGVGVEQPYRKRFEEDMVILSGVTVVSAELVEGGGTVRQNRWTRISGKLYPCLASFELLIELGLLLGVLVGPYTDGVGPDEGDNSLAGKVKRNVAKSLDAKTNAFTDLLRRGGIKDAEPHDEKDLQTIRWHKIAVRLAVAFHSFSIKRIFLSKCRLTQR